MRKLWIADRQMRLLRAFCKALCKAGHRKSIRMTKIKWIGLQASFVQIQAKLGQENLLRMERIRMTSHPVNTRHWTSVASTLARRLRRRPNIDPTLVQYLGYRGRPSCGQAWHHNNSCRILTIVLPCLGRDRKKGENLIPSSATGCRQKEDDECWIRLYNVRLYSQPWPVDKCQVRLYRSDCTVPSQIVQCQVSLYSARSNCIVPGQIVQCQVRMYRSDCTVPGQIVQCQVRLYRSECTVPGQIVQVRLYSARSDCTGQNVQCQIILYSARSDCTVPGQIVQVRLYSTRSDCTMPGHIVQVRMYSTRSDCTGQIVQCQVRLYRS